ncbi:hypothetical protein [Ursidibacter arcticus]|uniref:hypothetical protein n=1 Tax=Ursidibacter arcticus TaxID=1524965 RepID=UPI0012FA5885|nr:hypothetical protein [Ursidibacter arcticus]KAE9534674.1 hypothetical protein A1D25_06410 [Ursidibacter arcticus]
MKFIKSLLIISLSIFTSYSVQANTNSTKKTQQQSQALKRFSDSISLRFMSIDLKEDKQSTVSFNYILENKSKRTISQVHWATTYFHKDKPILVQNVPVSIKGGLKPKKGIPLEFSLPFKELPKEAQSALSIQGAKITAQFQAKKIVFSNGSKIEVK